jgi:hemerythrin-like domain-containing protein
MAMTTPLKKAIRKVEKAVTGEEPQIDILDTLEEEHQEVAALLTQLTESENARERKSLLRKVKQALIPHARAEEKVLYDALIAAKDKKPQQDGEEGYIEHSLADKLIRDLESIDSATGPEFGAAAKVLKEVIQHHVKEEESAFWSDAKDQFSSEERKLMNQKYLAAKRKIRIS